MEIVEANSRFESNYENGNWQEAGKMLPEMEKKFFKIHEDVEKNGIAVKKTDFTPMLKWLAATVERQDSEETEILFSLYQKNLFAYMDQFEYEYHPLLITMQKYIADEAKEAAEAGDYSEVESELREVLILQKNAENIFLAKGVSDSELQRFSFQLRKTINDCRQEDKKKVTEGVETLEKMLQAFLKKVHN
jgi:hypothetical protein